MKSRIPNPSPDPESQPHTHPAGFHADPKIFESLFLRFRLITNLAPEDPVPNPLLDHIVTMDVDEPNTAGEVRSIIRFCDSSFLFFSEVRGDVERMAKGVGVDLSKCFHVISTMIDKSKAGHISVPVPIADTRIVFTFKFGTESTAGHWHFVTCGGGPGQIAHHLLNTVRKLGVENADKTALVMKDSKSMPPGELEKQ